MDPEEDWQDDPTVDEQPHQVFNEPQFARNPAMFAWDSSSSEDEEFSRSSSSVSSIVPSEPEHEPSIVSSVSAVGSSESRGFRASIPICYGRNQYRAEEECLLVVYVDDILRIPMPGWPREDIQSIVQGLSGDWTTFYALIERGPPTSEPSGASDSQSLWYQDGGHLLAIEDAYPVASSATYPTLEESSLLLGLGGFNVGVVVAGFVLGIVMSLESVEIGASSCIFIMWLVFGLYRSIRVFVLLSWGGFVVLPSALGFRTAPPVALATWTSAWASQVLRGHRPRRSLVLWIILIIIFGLLNPSEASSVTTTMSHQPILYDQHALVLSSQAVCKGSPPSNPVTGYGGWWLVPLLLGSVTILIWETFKWAVRRFLISKKTAESQTQTEALPVIQHPIPEAAQPLARILFALWRADLSIPIELYEEDTQHEFFGYVGTYLQRLEEGSGSSD